MNRTYQEKSCGAVVFTKTEDGIKYLLLCEHGGFWVFPKGHMKPNETETETAEREILEETGLRVRFLPDFRVTDEHTLAREGHPERVKQTVYFLAGYENQIFRPQETEISSAQLLDFNAAMRVLQTDSFRRILTEAHRFLTSRV